MAEIQYQRLARPRSRQGFGLIVPFRSSLWLGEDHLLRLDSAGFSETYKRFYYRDIQAIIVRQTDHWKILALVCITVTAIITVLAGLAVASGSTLAAWIYGVLAAGFLLACILTVAAGPTCSCQIRTAVQVEDLPPLNTVRRARKALDRLRPLILAAQGQLAPEELPARLATWRGQGPVGNAPVSPTLPEANIPPIITPDG